MNCPSCGSPAPDGARFCPTCGHGLVARPDERRIATVVFADLVGFTTFSESADPEHVKNTVDGCFERLTADVEAFGGEVDKIVGDAIIALFGAPVAHEDDAERAVRAALQMQRTLRDLRARAQVAIDMRVGINSGEVLVGALRAGGDYTAMGDVVNTASRLQTLAIPGEVLVGPATYEATLNHVRYESRGAVELRGRDERVEVYAALEPLAPPGQRASRARSPLVGRDAEVEVLRTVLRTTIERRRAHFVLLAGEAGVGKTRLARELGAIARAEYDATVLLGHCAPYGEANVWFPIAEALRKEFGIEDDDSAEVVADKVRSSAAAAVDLQQHGAEVGRLTEGLLTLLGQSPGPDVDPARARDEAIRSLQTLLEGLASRRPLVLALADLHWADELVLELVERLMARFRTLPFVLAATTRPELEDRWVPKPGRHNAVFVNLDPLETETAEQLARVVLGPDADEELVALVIERSGGNPFFIEELAAVAAADQPATSAGREARLPGTLRGLIAARIDALEPAERAALEDCAVIGPSGKVELVTALASKRQGSEPTLSNLVDKDLIEVDGPEYVFKTDLIREVAYNTLTKAERARRHAALSHHLAERASKTGRVEEVLEQLATHFGKAAGLIAELGTVEGIPPDLNENAVAFLERAAASAAQQETWLLAQKLLIMALKISDDSDPERRLRLLLRRARARTELRNVPEARADIEEAMALAEARGDARGLARAVTILGDLELKDGDIPGSVATLAQAVQRWRELDDDGGLADALRAQGFTDLFRGELDSADRAIAEALECYRSAEDRRGEAAALQNLAWISFYRGELGDAETRLTESAKAFAETGDWGGLAWAHGLQAWVRFQQGRLDDAEQLAREVLGEAEELGNRWACGVMQVLLSNITLWRGETSASVEQAEAALGVFRELQDAWGELQALAPLARALTCLGRVREGRVALDDMMTARDRVQDAVIHEFGPVVAANIAVHTGASDARHLVERIASAVISEGFATEQAMGRGLVELQNGDARAAVETIEPVRSAAPAQGPGAAAGAALALAYAACGRPEDALSLGDQVEGEAVTYLDHLNLSLARGFALAQTDDRPRAEQAFWQALQIADRTESRLDQAIARLARAHAWAAMGRPDAAEARAEAHARLETLGLDAPGWETAFRLAAHGSG